MNKKEKVLVIDDDEALQKSCSMVFSAEGYAIEQALDGLSGLEKYVDFEPDVVLVDLMMPGVDGMEVLKRLASLDPDNVAIVITGYGTIQSAVEAMKRGAYDFLPKPFSPDQLRIIVKRGLERRRFIKETARLRREKEMMRNNFISMVSHELRSPLAAIQQNLMVITGGFTGEISDDVRKTMMGMQSRIKALISLINDWLNLSRIESGEMITGKSTVDLKRVLSEAVELLRPLADEKSITLRLDTPGSIPVIRGNQETLRMLFTNLIHNGIKYNKEGGSVAVIVDEVVSEVKVNIKDTGIGIAPDKLPLIFEQFYRIRGEDSVEGSGLGLAISKKIAELHAGSIRADSALGEGTVLTVRLPIGDEKQEGQA
jgi:two-component system sensor histidine kinase/response regulator